MKRFYSKTALQSLFFFCLVFNLVAQNQNPIWTAISSEKASNAKKLARKTEPKKAQFYQLDIESLKTVLSKANKNKTKAAENILVNFPNSNGKLETFRITESSILEADFQAKHPEIRTYIGQNVNHPASTITFSLTSQGLHAMTFATDNGVQFIDPYSKSTNQYIVYNKGDLPTLKKGFECYLSENTTVASKSENHSKALANANDGMLRTFRLALASTVEYSQYHWVAAGLNAGDSEADKKNAVLNAMVVTMTRVNGIFQRDLSVKMVLVDNTDIIFINTDNITNNPDDNEVQTVFSQIQTLTDDLIQPANYDIGHTFMTGNGGIVQMLGSVCVNDVKAMGYTGSQIPVGDAYDIDYVAHEMGHQFGAPHTFNGNAGGCGSGNRTASNAYEPGSGSTIMGYAGLCSSQNVQSNSDAYFHQKSIQMMWDNITTGNSTCGTPTATGNSAPIANAGSDYTIPISTPFKLTGNSTDPDGTSTHTYTWEQYDLGAAGAPDETNVTGPLFRSFEGTTDPVRYFPDFEDYLNTNGSTDWEKLPAFNRTMRFALTVRDNDVVGANGGGQTAVDFMNVTVNSTEPFTVSNPVNWAQTTTETINWNVGQTVDVGTINCQFVNIKLSTDGGLTFPTIIASNTPNDGEHTFTVPSISDTSSARLLIEAADNIFYDISDFDFSISANPDFFIVEEELTPVNCGDDSAVFTFDYVIANGFSENTTFSASNIPGGATATFSPSNLSSSGSVTLTIGNLDGVSQGDYTIIITGTATTQTKNKNVDFPFFNSICLASGSLEFQTSTTRVQFNTIDNTSAKSAYSDFTNISTDVNRNSSYDLTVNANTDGNFTTNTKVWIDWNQNCSFGDPGEEYNLGDATDVSDGPTGNSPVSITIPNNAILGNTIMRVATKYKQDGAPTSCENDFDGEVEDYTINVEAELSIQEFGFANFNVFPNPNQGEFKIKLNSASTSKINVEVYDVSGRMIYQNLYENGGDFNETVSLKHVQSGIYLLRVSDGLRRATKKIVVD
ncbi:reprolysin-like metallopeptidase [Tamlana crocina]|uniref:T9SS type A sorting domain-containing protein n=1 Tax=Tamlana crocina TaxID=393006 RepID=A0ABX1DB65_9FLAO|nr:zinc-dependent metalloprotease family protein [Tamlana crocina]NJX14467.1 T9SS type A sorting domain-containing protein [Tamlana crocina]